MTRTSTTQISETTITTIRLSLTKGYVKVCSHNSVSKSTIERATKVVLERFNSLKATIGCSHIETLSVLRELVLLYLKLGSHSIVVRMLLETTIEIIKKEKHSKTLHEAAKTMGSIYIACGMIEQGHEMIHEMRLQIITGSASSDKSSFKLDKPIGKICYVFLVAFEQTILGQMAISYSEIMADLLTETILYESLTRSINNKSNTEVILARAAGLRAFLVSRKRRVQIDVLDHQAHDNFVNKWGSTLKVQSEASRIFCIGLLEELGRHDTQHVNIGHSACVSSVAKVQSLLSEGRFQQAYDVALCALNFINQHRAYHQLQNVDYGIKLSELLAGRGLEKPLKSDIDTKVRNEMMELSRKIIHDVLQACKDSKFDFVRFRLSQLNRLIGLLGKQKSHIDLEVRIPPPPPRSPLPTLSVQVQHFHHTNHNDPTVAPQPPLVLPRSAEDLVFQHHHLHWPPVRTSHLRQPRPPRPRHPPLRRHLLQPAPSLGIPRPQDTRNVRAAVATVHEHGPPPRSDGRAREHPAVGRRRRRRR